MNHSRSELADRSYSACLDAADARSESHKRRDCVKNIRLCVAQAFTPGVVTELASRTPFKGLSAALAVKARSVKIDGNA